MVVSSTIPYSFYHRITASFISTFIAPSTSFYPRYWGAIVILVISVFESRSQRPSDAITIALSNFVRQLNTYISGSLVTPTLPATKSPILLVIANPGTYLFLSQTLLGPKNYGY
jgi:hypothetical protein